MRANALPRRSHRVAATIQHVRDRNIREQRISEGRVELAPILLVEVAEDLPDRAPILLPRSLFGSDLIQQTRHHSALLVELTR